MLTDEYVMPTGAYKGVKLANVPAEHLIWLYENNRSSKDLTDYIIDNLQILKNESRNKKS